MLRRQPYSEAAAQLVFMAWLHRIVNGGAEIEAHPAGVAAIDREYAVGSGRIDVRVRWPLPAGGESPSCGFEPAAVNTERACSPWNAD